MSKEFNLEYFKVFDAEAMGACQVVCRISCWPRLGEGIGYTQFALRVCVLVALIIYVEVVLVLVRPEDSHVVFVVLDCVDILVDLLMHRVMCETEHPCVLILDLLALERCRPSNVRVAAEHVPLVALEDAQHVLLVIALFVKHASRKPVDRPPHQYLQPHPLPLIAEPDLIYQRYLLNSGQQLRLGVLENLLIALLFVEEREIGRPGGAHFFGKGTLEEGVGEEKVAV